MGWEGASMYIPRGKGVAKAWYGQFVSLENQFTADRVWLRGRVMPTRGGGGGGGGSGGCGLEFSAYG